MALRWEAPTRRPPVRKVGPQGAPPPANRAAITAITVGHTLAWFSIEGCTVYVLYAGFTRRSDRRAGIAAAVVAGEALVFTANRFRCPLTQLAQRLGASHAGVTDLWLPKWFAHNLPAIHAPLLLLAVYLHARNLTHAERRVSRAASCLRMATDRLTG